MLKVLITLSVPLGLSTGAASAVIGANAITLTVIARAVAEAIHLLSFIFVSSLKKFD